MKLLMALALTVSAAAPATEPRKYSSRATIRTLLENRNMKLKGVGCDTSMGPTVGDYVSFLLGTMADSAKEDLSRLTVACVDEGKGKFPVACEFTAHVQDKAGESPWDYGLKFKRTADGKKIDEASLMCPGTP